MHGQAVFVLLISALFLSPLSVSAQNTDEKGNGTPTTLMALTSPGETTDTDGDGMLDCWEKRYFRKTDPNSQRLEWEIPDAYDDADSDGVVNADERAHMTDPTDPTDYFTVEEIIVDISGNVVVRWHSVEGQAHSVYRSTEVGPGATWQLVHGPVTGTGSTMEYSEPVGSGPAFFRVSVEPRQPDYWPNEFSNGNSDDWIMANHDRIYEMRPKVLVLNFMNSWNNAESMGDSVINAVRWSSKYRYFKNSSSKWFLRYDVAKHVDLRDPPGTPTLDGNSTKFPRRPNWTSGNNFLYEELYTEQFAEYYGYVDPENPSRYLTLGELMDLGLVNELWFFAYHGSYGAPYETIELKQYYDWDLNKRVGVYGAAGNGHWYAMPWTGRSFRITFINGNRGVGCVMENFGHAAEGMANYNFCPYYKQYFDDFAGFNLMAEYGLPFNSFYWYWGSDNNNYPDPTTLEWQRGGSSGTLYDYIAFGGNVHFPPNGRSHYDQNNTQPVMSTIEHAFMRNGPGGEDRAELWNTTTKLNVFPYNSVAPDCMGKWLIFWRQAMPGRFNTCTDDDGEPMPNWWVFLFY